MISYVQRFIHPDSADRATQSKNEAEQREADTLTLITTGIQESWHWLTLADTALKWIAL